MSEIVGIGVDIVEVERIARAMRSPRFIERILTPAERKRPMTALYVAGRWAAKEAVAKALGRSMSWLDVEILNSESGAPVAYLVGEVTVGPTKIWVSISHEKGHAVAMAVATA